MISISNNRILQPDDDIIYLQVPLPYYTMGPQEVDSWNLATEEKNGEECAHVAVDIESDNSSSVIDSVSDAGGNSDSDFDSDSDSISMNISHLQTGTSVPNTPSAAVSAANRMVAPVPVNTPVPVNAPAGQVHVSPSNYLIGACSVAALASLSCAIVFTLQATEQIQTNSEQPPLLNELAGFKVLAGLSFFSMLATTGCTIKNIVSRLQN